MNIKTLSGISGSNTYVVELDGTYIVIDAGAPPEAVKRILGDRKLSAIFLTHEHFDHIYYIADYAHHFIGCPIYCHPAALNEIRTNKLNSSLTSSLGADTQVKRVLRFDSFKELSHGQVLNVLPLQITVIFGPGHSEGSVLYIVNNIQKSNPILFAGDVLFKGSIGRTDLMENGSALMQQTLKRLQNITFEASYHGHGSPCNFEQQKKNIARHLG